MDAVVVTAVGLGIIGYGIVSRKIERSILSAPILFVAFGYAISGHGLGIVNFEIDHGIIDILAGMTLILVLFTDASRIDLKLLRKDHNIPIRLLTIGLPLTIAAGAIIAVLVFSGVLTFWEAALLAAILSPTDAALGQAVVSSPLAPRRIRQALNVESGLNDGLMLPIILILISIGCGLESSQSVGYWIRFTAMQVILGPIIGVAVGYLGGKLVELCVDRGWMNHTFRDLSSIGLAFLAFSLAELVHGNGFIAAFCAGLAIGNTIRSACSPLYEFGEAEGQLLSLLVFMIFGAVMLPEALERLDWQILLYGVLSLTVVRMLPVAVSLIGAKLRPATVAFLGWFGPRGLASILFALLVVEQAPMQGAHDITTIVVITVLLSVLAHGVSANPLTKAYAAHLNAKTPDETAEERQSVSEMPLRLRSE